MPDIPERIVLIGPSGAGKSSIARALGERWAKPVIDTDDELSDRIGMSITEFFARFGEPAFRAIERDVVKQACQRGPAVIATGGGAVLYAENWAAWRADSVVVGLAADPATLVARVSEQTGADGERAERPLLAGNAEERIRALIAQRAALYAQADITVDTSALDHSAAIDAVEHAVLKHATEEISPRLSLLTPSGRSDIYIGRGARARLGTTIRQRWPRSRRVWLVSDEHVAAAWADEVCESLERDGLRADTLVVQPGETSKSLADVERLCREMTDRGATRDDVVVALGGGAVLDAGVRAALAGHTGVFLDVGLRDAARRTGFDTGVALMALNPRGQWLGLMEARRPRYEAAAALRIDTSGRTADEVLEEIVAALDPAHKQAHDQAHDQAHEQASGGGSPQNREEQA